MMLLQTLPNELLLHIGEGLDQPSLNSIMRTGKFFFLLFTPRLHELALRDKVGNSRALLPALCWAAEQGHEPLVRHLLKNGVNVDSPAKFDHGKGPLYYAAMEGHITIGRMLLNAGADMGARIEDGYLSYTPLHIAAENGHAEFVKLLLENRAAIAAAGGKSRTPFFCAIQSESSVGAEYRMLLASALRDSRHLEIITLKNILRAMERRSVETVQVFLANGATAEINNKDIEGMTPLHWAALSHHWNDLSRLIDVGDYKDMGFMVFKLLLEAGATVDAIDNYGYTPLHEAVIAMNVPTVGFLLDQGANVNCWSNDQMTPLMCAVDDPTSLLADTIISLLLGKGADVNARGPAGETALHLAVRHSKHRDQARPERYNNKIISILLDGGADINSKCDEGFTA